MAYNGYDEQSKKAEERFMSDRRFSKENKSYVEKHLAYMSAKGMHPRTLMKHLYCLNEFFSSMDRGVDMKKAERGDIEKAMAKIERGRLATETKRNVRSIVKAFYKHLLGDDLYYPPQVAWIKTSQKSGKKMLPEDILSEKEVIKMLEAAKNPRDKAIIALLFDSGIRMGELMGMRIKDAELDTEPAHIVVNGKTGMRKIPLMFSVPYLAQYLNSQKKRKPSDPMWIDIGSWANKNKVPDYAAIRKRLQEVGKDAGIHKRIYPHLFRHSRATFYANRLTEQQLKAFFGWTGGSAMAATYVHLSGRDLDNSILKAYGKSTPETDMAPELTAKECPRCRRKNELDAVFCAGCGASLDINTAMKTSERSDMIKKAALEQLKDPKVIDRIVDLLSKEKEGKAGKKKKE